MVAWKNLLHGYINILGKISLSNVKFTIGKEFSLHPHKYTSPSEVKVILSLIQSVLLTMFLVIKSFKLFLMRESHFASKVLDKLA